MIQIILQLTQRYNSSTSFEYFYLTKKLDL